MKHFLLIALITLSACQQDASSPAADPGKAAGPPPPPPYQVRGEAPSGDRLAAGRDGKALYQVHCGYCHMAGGMGTNLLTKQRMMAGEGSEMGLLTNRPDLTAAYVKAVVRSGKNAMPPQTRVDLTEPELTSVAAYLGKGK